MIDPKVTVAWPDDLRWLWIAVRMSRAARRNRRDHTRRGGRFREWFDAGDPVG